MSGWQTVLDEQLDLYRFWRSDMGRMSAEGFGESMIKVAREVGGAKQVAAEHFFVERLREIEIMKCFACDPVYVAGEMMPLIEFAAESFAPEPLQESDLVTKAGFLVLPAPLYMRDRHDKRVAFRIVCWYPAGSGEGTVTGVHLSLYSHYEDEDEYRMGELAARWAHEAGTPYSLAHVTSWGFDQAVPTLGAEEQVAINGWWVPVQAMFRLMMQTVTQRSAEPAPRGARKRWQRSGPNPSVPRGNAPNVTVVRLRRPASQRDEGGEHKEVGWTKRWIVSGHWRNQWFPSLNLHRQVWISPYVKGPEDAPLVVRKAHAYEFVK